MRFLKKLFLKTFLTLFFFASVIWLLTRSDNGKVIFYQTMRKIFHVETVVVGFTCGLADQIGQYGYGEEICEKYRLPVKYGFRWFKKGKDDDGRFSRVFQLKSAFPDIRIEAVNEFTQWLHRSFFRFSRKPQMRKEYGIQILKDKFHPIDIDTCKDLLDDINARKSCAVHVRRGDLSHVGNVINAYPTQAEFFILAVRKIHALDPNVKFFFFSEEPDWIREKVLPALDKKINCRVCDQNDSSKGYLDLYLISRCDHVIASLGGFGHAGRLFSYKKGYYLRGIASDEYHFDWSLKHYDGEKIGEEIEKGSVDVRELTKAENIKKK